MVDEGGGGGGMLGDSVSLCPFWKEFVDDWSSSVDAVSLSVCCMCLFLNDISSSVFGELVFVTCGASVISVRVFAWIVCRVAAGRYTLQYFIKFVSGRRKNIVPQHL